MKKKDLIFICECGGTISLFNATGYKADEQTSSDQTFENTAIVLKADTSSNTEASPGMKLLKITLNFGIYLLKKKIETEYPSSAVFTSLSSNRKEEQRAGNKWNDSHYPEAKKPVVRFQSRIIIQWRERLMQLFVMLKPNGLKRSSVPTWSLENGQDDRWHKAMRQNLMVLIVQKN